jgi:hypothetical protein
MTLMQVREMRQGEGIAGLVYVGWGDAELPVPPA